MFFLNDIEDGTHVRYNYEDEKVASLFVKNGMPEGNNVWYHPNGCEKVIGDFVDGKCEGYFYSFWENGFVKEVREHENDKLVGVIEKYSSNGDLIEIVDCNR